MRVERIVVGPLEANCWVVDDGSGGPVVVIDPGADIEAIAEVVGQRPVCAVVLTHCHFDHLGAAAQLVGATGAQLLVHTEDAEFIEDPVGTGGVLFGFEQAVAPKADRILHEGDRIPAGRLEFEVVHTPGHTPGGICLLVSDPGEGVAHLFSGDTLFSGSVGRTDFPRGDGRALAGSIAQKLAALPLETIVHPGHGPDTTIARERRLNPFWPRA